MANTNMINKVMEKEVLIIIPAYNERGNIEKLLSQLRQPKIAGIADILVMDDASSDGTNWIAKEKRVAVVTHVFNSDINMQFAEDTNM